MPQRRASSKQNQREREMRQEIKGEVGEPGDLDQEGRGEKKKGGGAINRERWNKIEM